MFADAMHLSTRCNFLPHQQLVLVSKTLQGDMWVHIVYWRPTQDTHRWLVKPDTPPHCLQE
jgi:hypothetical protein